MEKKFLPFILPILIIVVWYILTEGLGLIPYYILPSPVHVFNAAVKLIANGKLIDHTISTLTKVFSGIILASIVAIPLGIILGW